MKTLTKLSLFIERIKLNLIIFTFLLSCFSFNLFCKTFKISVSQVIQHKALDRSRQGIYDELKDNGYIDGKNIEWSYSNAQGSPVLASQIAQKYIGQGSDIIVTLGTSVTQAAISASKSRIPIVFGSVTDPKGIGIGKNIHNVTGVSNLTPSLPQFQFFKELEPALQRLGVIYNPGEPNSQALIKEMQTAAKEIGIKIVLAPVFKTIDVYATTLSLKGKVDAVFVNNDNTVLAAFNSVVEAAKQMGIPAFVSDVDLVSLGARGALGPDQYELGRQVGKMVIRIINGQSADDIPIEYAQKLERVIN